MPEPGLELLGWTKAQIEAIAEGVTNITGLSVKLSVVLATAEALPTNAYANGTEGVGATLTATLVGALEIDGSAVTVGKRILVKNEAEAKKNGIYVVTKAGGLAEKYVLTRSTDQNKASEFDGAFTFVESGTVNAGTAWAVASSGAVTVGTTAIEWTEIGLPGEVKGPGSSTENDLAVFSGGSGKVIKDSGVLLSSVVTSSLGEGAPAKGLGLNVYYIQVEGSKHIALWRGKGAGEEPEQIADLTGTPAKESVTTEKLTAGAVVAAVLGAEAVEEAKIAALAVTEAKIGAEAVASAKIKAAAVSEGKLGSEAVSAAKLKKEAVTAAKIGNLGLGTRYATQGYTVGGATAAPGAKSAAIIPVKILQPCTLTGVNYQVGTTKNGKVAVALYNAAGELLKKSVEAGTEQSEAEHIQAVAFESTLAIAEPQIAWVVIVMESATGTWMQSFLMNASTKETLSEFKVPASIAVPSTVQTFTKVPIIAVY